MSGQDEQSGMSFTENDMVAGMPDELVNTPIGPTIGIGAIALNMALKYHDINTIHDGTLYQQYKLEGRNMHGLHLDMVFHTAEQIERHLIAANKRVAALMVAATLDVIEEEDDSATPVEE